MKNLNVIADAPSKVDLLGYTSYINALGNIIKSEKTITPFSIGVMGDWGCGKSTFMMQLASQLTKDEFPTIVFNPWKYDGKEEVWHALIQTILITFEKGEKSKGAKEKILAVSQSIGKMLASKALSKFSQGTIELEEIIDSYSKITNENLKFINEFESTFTSLVSRYAKDKKIVIFIDDLDRCLPENVIKVLEAIKLFLSVPKCIFILGIENNIIQEGIKHRYGSSIGLSGKDYLEKIIQLPFSIPSPSEKNILNFTDLLSNGQFDRGIKTLIINGCESNPRRIKRFINSFNLLCEVIKEEYEAGIREVKLNENILAFVLLLQLRYPIAYDYYFNNPVDFKEVLNLLSEEKYYAREEIERISATNPVYNEILKIPQFNKIMNLISANSEMNFEVGEEGLLEYFSAAQSIATSSSNFEQDYYLPEIQSNTSIYNFSENRDLVLVEVGRSKLALVKAIKDATGLGLKEAKEIADNGNGTIIMTDVPPSKQPQILKEFESQDSIVEFN